MSERRSTGAQGAAAPGERGAVTGEDVEALAAGELSPDEAERVLAAIASSAELAEELDEALQMRALGHELEAAATPIGRAQGSRREGYVVRPRRARRWRIAAPVLVLAAAAAVGIYVAVQHRSGAPHNDTLAALDARVAAALAPDRAIQPRLSWPGADHYRPYDAPRAAAAPAEHLSFELLAEIEKLRDPRALAAAKVLVGSRAEAAADLAREPASPGAASDRAALALLGGDAERALIEAADALAREPAHPQAQWNRALALTALGLDRSAAAQFDAIAERGEGDARDAGASRDARVLGWSGEARAQATALHAARARRDEAWKHVVAAGAAMVGGGAPITDQVAALPGASRHYFYDAVRAAPSAARVRELAPLADALDARFGGAVLRAYVERVAAAPFGKRAALAPRYAALVRGELDSRAARTLVADLRAAHQDDMLIGALVLAQPSHLADASDLDELARLATAAGDPWLTLLAAEQRGWSSLAHGDAAAAERALRDAAATCTGAFADRCARIDLRLATAYLQLRRIAAATDAVARARRAAAEAGAVDVEDELLGTASLVALWRDDLGASRGPLVTAYLDESRRSAAAAAR